VIYSRFRGGIPFLFHSTVKRGMQEPTNFYGHRFRRIGSTDRKNNMLAQTRLRFFIRGFFGCAIPGFFGCAMSINSFWRDQIRLTFTTGKGLVKGCHVLTETDMKHCVQLSFRIFKIRDNPLKLHFNVHKKWVVVLAFRWFNTTFYGRHYESPLVVKRL
jgi:hypothetical protein